MALYFPMQSTANHQKPTSMSTFRKYIRLVPDPADPSRGSLDASEIVSKACYEEWMSAREYDCADHAGKTFQRALTGHISASDGRLPFSPEEEAAILKVIRAKRIWYARSPLWL